MHFFHFPVKDKDRLDVWIAMANKPAFKEYPLTKLKNQNVCEEHFKLNQFMNIKKERLTRFAIPTLLKLRTGEVIDLEANEVYMHDWSIKSYIPDELDVQLYETPEVIIPPVAPRTEQQPQQQAIVHNYTLNVEKVTDAEIHIEKSDSTETYALEDDIKPEEQQLDNLTLTMVDVDSAVQTPNKLLLAPVKRNYVTVTDIQQADVKILSPVPIKRIKTMFKKLPPVHQLVQTKPPEPPKIYNEVSVQCSIQSEEEKSAVALEVSNAAQTKRRYEDEIRKTNLKHQVEVNKYVQQIKQLKDEVAALKSQINDIPTPPTLQTTATQTNPIPVAKIQASPNKPTEAAAKPAAALSKPQLFNSIKRYLSNAMTTLLKMEVFGGGDREWKQDEKKFSCEIMSLGDNIYSHFVDEWRLRLPPKSNVEQWMNECMEDDEDL